MSLVRSKKRVADHGEVFTPDWMVEAMLDLVKGESVRIESRFLEPACGSGNFLKVIIDRKLDVANARYGKNDFEKRNYALLSLMSSYGIEILGDNVAECRENLLKIFADFLNIDESDEFYRAAKQVLELNIVHGDALTMQTETTPPESITFPEWTYMGKGKFERRDFRFETLTQMSSFGEGTLFEDIGKHEIFIPSQDYPTLTVKDISGD
jgi:hypothetical protein